MATTGEPFGLFWDSESGDRTYSAASFEYWLKKFFTSGVFNGDLQVKASSGMTLEIEPGYANVDGKVKFWNGAFTLTLNAANSTYPRIDTIVITRDNVNRQIVCEVVTGAYSGDAPQPTAPIRNSEIYQLVLAQVYVGAGVTGITQANITDTRPDNDLCGWITGTVEELDFSQFTAQFEQYFREFKADAEGDYESWFNEVQSEQIEDKEAWDAWYAALQEELHNLPADSAEYLQIQIDELKESGLSGSIFKVTTINPSLEGKTVRIINADNTEEKTGTFDSNLECVIYGMKSVGEITITSTDGIETATSVISIPYFGNYTVPIAFWAATVNMQGDTNLYGATITIKDSDNLTVGTVVLSAVDGTGTFTASKADTYTFNYTYQGTSYSQELVVSEETTYSISLSAGFSWVVWVDTASQLDSTDYESLDEVLEDEKALRELFLEHACVDYMAELTSSNEDLETVINNDLCAKWINNSDYALDFLGANTVIKALMDEADKYGYGEWALMPQVPKMTSNTAPFGEAIGDTCSSGYELYRAFDGDNSTMASRSSASPTGQVGYKFSEAISIRRAYVYTSSITDRTVWYKVQYSDDNSTWTDASEQVETKQGYIDIDDCGAHIYWRIVRITEAAISSIITTLQFYAWAPKGNVPVMSANTAPHGEVIYSSTYSTNYPFHAFDRDYNSSGHEWISNGSTNQYVGYKFTNPVCVKRAFFDRMYLAGEAGTRVKNYKIQASNDNSTWVDLYVGLEENNTPNMHSFKYVDIDNDSYYLYYRMFIVDAYYSYPALWELQFYGRELKVSVPTMTSNTAPYGEVIYSSYRTAGLSVPMAPYMAFDKSTTSGDAWQCYNVEPPQYIGYKFTNKMKIKQIHAHMFANRSFTWKFQASDNGTDWTDLTEEETLSVSSNGTWYARKPSKNEGEYQYYRLYLVNFTNSDSGKKYQDVGELNFYGLDYSEKEFEAGTTKKWLYDHGVELETLTTPNGGVKFGSNQVEISASATNTNYSLDANLDLTDYDLVRFKIGDRYVSTSLEARVNTTEILSWGQSSIAALVANIATNYPDFGLDISSVNGTYYLLWFTNTGSGTPITLTELWLE